MKTKAFLVTFASLIAACSGSDPAQNDDATDTEVTNPVVGEDGGSAEGPGAGPPDASALSERNELYIFEYRYPDVAKAEPMLADLLNQRAANAKAELIEQATEGREAAEDSGFPFNGYSFRQKWSVAADIPRFLSLSSVMTVYTGGAHDNLATRTLVWDREQKEALASRDFFTSISTLENALGERFCAELDRQRARKRGQKVDSDSNSGFDDCPPFSDLVILLGSSGKDAFNRIGLVADPYVAGPWAEGTYEVSLPVTVEVIDAVKPEFAGSFVLGR